MEKAFTEENIDYQGIEKAIDYLVNHFQEQPNLKTIAQQVHLSKHHFSRMFSKWAGIPPQKFMHFLTKEYVKELLEQAHSLTEVSYRAGLSGTGRLHDLFVNFEALSPGEYKRGGANLAIEYGLHTTPFGTAFIAVTKRGIFDLSFIHTRMFEPKLEQLKTEMSAAQFVQNQEKTRSYIQQIFGTKKQKITLLLRGTNFQIKVWQALLKIPSGQVATYGDVAQWIGRPKAQRAVGTAIGKNNIAYLIPCHRVIQKAGTSGQYRWGILRKKAMLGLEAAQNYTNYINVL